MEISTEQLKQRNLCPILVKNKWHYQSKSSLIQIREDLIASAVNWLSRRGSHITWEVYSTIIGRELRDVDQIEASKIFMTLRHFYYTYYRNMVAPLSRHTIEVQFREGTIFESIPIIDEDNVVTFYLFENITSKSLLIKSAKARFISVWASICLEENILIKNINLDNEENELLILNPTGKYIENSKKALRSMLKLSAIGLAYPTEDVCRSCQNLEICPA